MPYKDPLKQQEYNKQYLKKHYQLNKKYYADRNIKRRVELVEFITSLKQKPCMDCGVQYPHYVMDFDHRENKKYNVSLMGRRLLNSKESILKEIEKCDLICSNCHRIRTYKRLHSEIV